MEMDIVQRARAGDLDAFTSLVGVCQRRVAAIAWARTGDAELAREVTQEVFLDVWRSLPMLRQPAAFPGWLRTIVVKHADRVTRRKSHETVAYDDEIGEDSPDTVAPLEGVERSERAERVRRAIGRLPELLRDTVALSLSDRSHAEIADMLDVPLSTVKKRLHDARRQIRPYLLEETDMTILDDPNLPAVVRAFVAARTGDLHVLTAMLDARPDQLHAVEQVDPSTVANSYAPSIGTTLLGEAIIHGKADIVGMLLARGADPERPLGALGPALSSAVLFGHTAVVERLLAHGVDVAPEAWHGGTPLHAAAIRGRAEIVELLLAAGAIDRPNVFGWTARRWAEHNGDQRVLLALERASEGVHPDLLAREKANTDGGRGDPSVGGRIIDPSGRPLDGGPALSIPSRSTSTAPARQSGIKAVDLLCPLVAGVHELAAGPWVGKTVLIGELAHNLGPVVVAGFVDRTFEVRDLEHVLRELGVWDNAVLVLAVDENDAPALVKTALALAQSRGTLLVADDRLGDLLHAASPRVPVLAFGPHVHPDPEAQPRWGGRIVLDPERAKQRCYPAVDLHHTVGVSWSSDRHRALAEQVRSLQETDIRMERISAFLTQPFAVAAHYNGRPGVRVSLDETLDGVQRLLDGTAVDAASLRYVGRLDEAGSWPTSADAPF